VIICIEHREPAYRYQAAFVADSKTVEYSFELLIDGPEAALGENDVSRLYWDGDGLRAIERIRGAGRDQDNVWEFERR
jgi:hypothetical protein